jgi:DHA1 family bicyclomycin/chloramphenicol resistance-like MFS transporter
MGVLFPPVFAGVAGGMAIGSFLNAKIVGRVGMRRVSHSAMLGFIVIAAAHMIVAYAIGETLVAFFLFQSASMFCAGLVNSNFNAIAMEPMGHVAGTASSIQGFLTTVGSGLLALAIGQNFAGSANALIVGNLLYGSAIIIIVILVEGRLFQSTAQPPSTAAP